MIKKLRLCDFVREFDYYDRYNQFTYGALEVLFDYYEEVEQSYNEPIEMDVIAICCDWTEYTEEELKDQFEYMLINDDDYTPEDELDLLLDRIRENTIVLDVKPSNTYLVYTF